MSLNENVSENYLIRQATIQDVPRILELHFAGLKETNSCSTDTSLDADLYHFSEHYQRVDTRFVVAVSRLEAIVGMGALVSLSSDHYEIKRMRVASHCRRQGIAQQILDELLTFAARQHPQRDILLDSSQTQTAAHRLYENNGFVCYGEALIGGDIPSYLFRRPGKAANCLEREAR
ncbi:GNAT family N-acetyltransferase [Pantoea phytobeneficialis]|uniref:GCN5-related N-acetyltransferase n=1 Tax=Pantoea phytobeneficialis TaxID=2052056 RepID=A0AAP9H989_9GAMM|nr:GNAT family N-acetyltransferase [Pantoea phytobeneficialis]MDO6407169.1 GNAT family N-acetyltransferase [Pantoea phytobeneficialis]QGR09140.1 GCN5-related N-acetyltransferase [Pantoea phytobeneficialis]